MPVEPVGPGLLRQIESSRTFRFDLLEETLDVCRSQAFSPYGRVAKTDRQHPKATRRKAPMRTGNECRCHPCHTLPQALPTEQGLPKPPPLPSVVVIPEQEMPSPSLASHHSMPAIELESSTFFGLGWGGEGILVKRTRKRWEHGMSLTYNDHRIKLVQLPQQILLRAPGAGRGAERALSVGGRVVVDDHALPWGWWWGGSHRGRVTGGRVLLEPRSASVSAAPFTCTFGGRGGKKKKKKRGTLPSHAGPSRSRSSSTQTMVQHPAGWQAARPPGIPLCLSSTRPGASLPSKQGRQDYMEAAQVIPLHCGSSIQKAVAKRNAYDGGTDFS